jgi:hypothetical protein
MRILIQMSSDAVRDPLKHGLKLALVNLLPIQKRIRSAAWEQLREQFRNLLESSRWYRKKRRLQGRRSMQDGILWMTGSQSLN